MRDEVKITSDIVEVHDSRFSGRLTIANGEVVFGTIVDSSGTTPIELFGSTDSEHIRIVAQLLTALLKRAEDVACRQNDAIGDMFIPLPKAAR